MCKGLDITLGNNRPSEDRTRTALCRLLEKNDLRDWIFTNAVEINETASPHSHPLLTLNTSFEADETLLLAEFLHEQLHWFEEQHAADRDRAIEETVRYYPAVPTIRPEGAGDEESTRLHLLVCYLEYQALKMLVGEPNAQQAIVALSQHHYCWVYRTVLTDEDTIGGIIRRFDLVPEPLRPCGS